jgi:hypothetical protein
MWYPLFQAQENSSKTSPFNIAILIHLFAITTIYSYETDFNGFPRKPKEAFAI